MQLGSSPCKFHRILPPFPPPIPSNHRSFHNNINKIKAPIFLPQHTSPSITFCHKIRYNNKMGDQQPSQVYQNVVVMRHGDRLDNVEPLWAATAERPWDPPLEEDGKVRAYCTGRKIRTGLGFPIHRVFVSPFLRCLQTASEVIKGLCAVADNSDDPNDLTSKGVVIDPTKIKVSIEYGLCEMLNTLAIRADVAPKDGVFSFDIPQCEALLPAGTVDNTVKKVYDELPKWQETAEGSRARYTQMIKALADLYPSENLLLVSHGEGVGSAVCSYVKGVDAVYGVDYCAYSVLQRPISFGENQSFDAGDFSGEPEAQVGVKLIL